MLSWSFFPNFGQGPFPQIAGKALGAVITSILHWQKNEPVHEISNNVVCATSKASDQPAHTGSLIRAFASRLSILWLVSYWLNIIWRF